MVDALEELYRRCVGKTVAFAIRRCGTPEQVHDLVAATWIELIAASSRYDPSEVERSRGSWGLPPTSRTTSDVADPESAKHYDVSQDVVCWERMTSPAWRKRSTRRDSRVRSFARSRRCRRWSARRSSSWPSAR